MAVINHDVERVKQWIESDPDVLRRVITSSGGWTPMHAACFYNQTEILKCMLEADLNIITVWEYFTRRCWQSSPYNLMTTFGWSPIFYSSSNEIVELMLQFRAKLRDQFHGKFEDLDVVSKQGTPLLWEFAGRGILNETIVQHLIDQISTGFNGILPVENALENRHTEACIQGGNLIEIWSKEKFNGTFLHI